MFFSEQKSAEILNSKNLSISVYRLMFFLISISDSEGKIKNYSPEEMVKITKINRSQISRGLKELLENEIIYYKGKNYYFDEKLLDIE